MHFSIRVTNVLYAGIHARACVTLLTKLSFKNCSIQWGEDHRGLNHWSFDIDTHVISFIVTFSIYRLTGNLHVK